jgi:hypothetical protein
LAPVIAHYALNGQMRSKAHTTLTAPLVLHHTRIYKCAMKKIIINGQMPKKHFLIVIYHSSLVKAAMNAVNCTMVLKKCPISSFFTDQRRNKDHSALVNCGGIEFLSFLDRHIYECKLWNERKTLNPNAQ